MKNSQQQQDLDDAVSLEGASLGARRASVEAPSKKADAEAVAVARRRTFTRAYMQRIVREADACTAPGAIGELLRREGLYSSHLSTWRAAVAASDAALQSPKRVPKPDPPRPPTANWRACSRRTTSCASNWAGPNKSSTSKKLCDLLGLPTAGEVS